LIALCRALLSERGEVSGARLAVQVRDAYRSLDANAKEIFFDRLVTEFSPDPANVSRAASAYAADPSEANLVRLQAAVEPPRQELFRRFNTAPGATGVLVEMRGHVLRTLVERPERISLDADLSHLFRSWFNRGFLVLQRIDWRTSALVLERLIQYEAVHQIQGWRDLRRRLEIDRRCYAFFHPALPDEPLIFIEVALTRGMAAHVQPLLDPDAPVVNPDQADSAVFYSITNCQEGLRGIPVGNFLIKQVAEDLGREFRRLKTLATLSPAPGFVTWLRNAHAGGTVSVSSKLAALIEQAGRGSFMDASAISDDMREEVFTLCAHYLLDAKRGEDPLDPVARFHLANGARLERLNWMGDTSGQGLKRSLGIMANYVYRLPDVDRNHEAYAHDHRIVASRDLEKLAKQAAERSRSHERVRQSRGGAFPAGKSAS
jgi:malonyl-CoA decarboxylase